MKLFRKLVKLHRSDSGKVKHKTFMEALGTTKYYKSFTKLRGQLVGASWKKVQYVYGDGYKDCAVCGKQAVWIDRDERFSKWCSIKCQNNDPSKLERQIKTYSKRTEERRHTVQEILNSYRTKIVSNITEMDIKAFSIIVNELTSSKGVLEITILKQLTEKQLKVWCNVHHGSYRYRLLIATGKMDINPKCKRCNCLLTHVHQRGWKTFCSSKCAGMATVSKRVTPEAISKMQKSLKVRYSIKSNNDALQKHLRRGMFEKYGAENPSQVYEIARRRKGSKHKAYVLGERTVYIQGYEDKALRYLNKWFKAKEIVVSSEGGVPVIDYRLNSKSHLHYPDIFIPHRGLIIEVKSSYTLFGRGEAWARIKAKRKAAIGKGFLYSVLLMNRDGTRFTLPKNWHTLSKESIESWFNELESRRKLGLYFLV